jgi:hypothetical protein
MDAEEIKQQLRDMGIPIDQWEDSGGKTVKSDFLNRQKSMLEKAKDLLEMQLANDIKLVGELQEKVSRLEHGGGS